MCLIFSPEFSHEFPMNLSSPSNLSFQLTKRWISGSLGGTTGMSLAPGAGTEFNACSLGCPSQYPYGPMVDLCLLYPGLYFSNFIHIHPIIRWLLHII